MEIQDQVRLLSDSARANFKARHGLDGWAYTAGYVESMLVRAIEHMNAREQKMFREYLDIHTRANERETARVLTEQPAQV